MPKEPTIEPLKKKFEAKTSKIKEEYERKKRALEKKIEQHKRERDDGLTEAEKQYREGFFFVFKSVLGKDDYDWLCKWLVKIKEKEIEEAEKSHEKKHVDELEKMTEEDYLFWYFYDPQVEERLKKDIEQGKPEEVQQLSFILAKLRLEKMRLNRTKLDSLPLSE